MHRKLQASPRDAARGGRAPVGSACRDASPRTRRRPTGPRRKSVRSLAPRRLAPWGMTAREPEIMVPQSVAICGFMKISRPTECGAMAGPSQHHSVTFFRSSTRWGMGRGGRGGPSYGVRHERSRPGCRGRATRQEQHDRPPDTHAGQPPPPKRPRRRSARAARQYAPRPHHREELAAGHRDAGALAEVADLRPAPPLWATGGGRGRARREVGPRERGACGSAWRWAPEPVVV
jgi:hypothetical protein